MSIVFNDGYGSPLTKEFISEQAIYRFSGIAVLWRNNNVPVRRRKNHIKKGVSDIVGYMRDGGQYIVIEVKTETDRLSDEQKAFLIDVNKCGGYAYVAQGMKNGSINIYLYLNDKS